jgi:formylglycine-generating enzyme required for sulfatase activity
MTHKALGDYDIIKQIGEGALGQVLLAEHRFMKRHYALKVLPEDLASDRGFVQRFEEEVKRLATLEHPHIVKIHNISYSQGNYFLVTDCVVDALNETTNLAQYVSNRGGQLPEEEMLGILRQVADALDYAHGKQGGDGGTVHRGLKPSNVLIGKGKSGVHVYLSDFGLSKILGASAMLGRTYGALVEALGADESKLHALVRQNYNFLAPEQKSVAHAATVGPVTDSYAFGVLAYYLLTGGYPEGMFAMPSTLGRYTLNWDVLIRACLQVDPQARPTSLLDALDEVEEPVAGPTARVAPTAPVKPPVAPVRIPAREPVRQSVPESVREPAMAAAAAPQPAFKMVTPKAPLPTLESIIPKAPVRSAVGPYPVKTGPHVTAYHPEEKEQRNVEPILTDMVVVLEGTYHRGSNEGNRDEMPRHKVHLKSFAIDVHPVTNEQFARFVEYNGGEKDAQNHDLILFRESRIRRQSGKLVIESGYSKHPVVGVTWYGAVAYANWVGKRLPYEAEWEVACASGREGMTYPTGEVIEKSQANFFSADTTPVQSYPPNELGFYDIVGNVYEWCQDWYGYNYYDTSAHEPDQPTGPLQGVYRVLRGGCWKSLTEDLRCSHRHRNNPGTVNSTYGFRCATDVD